jgi:uncharacterized protein with HEPN domain
MDFDQWQRDQKTVDAVVRNLEIIGEAASHVPQDIQSRFSSIPWGKMKGIRNIMIHAYFGVDVSILWTTINEDLPTVKRMLHDVLNELK